MPWRERDTDDEHVRAKAALQAPAPPPPWAYNALFATHLSLESMRDQHAVDKVLGGFGRQEQGVAAGERRL